MDCFKQTIAPKKKPHDSKLYKTKPMEIQKQPQDPILYKTKPIGVQRQSQSPVYKGTILSEQTYQIPSQSKIVLPQIQTSPNYVKQLPKTHSIIPPTPTLPPIEKPQPVKTKHVPPKDAPKSSKRLSQVKVKKQKLKLDPVLVVLAVTIFLLLGITSYTIYTLLSLLAMGAAALIAFYHILSRKSPESQYKYKTRNASVYSIAILIMPFAFGILNAVDVLGVFESAFGFDKYGLSNKNTIFSSIHTFDAQYSIMTVVQAVFIWSLTLSFWQTMLFVPLAIRSVAKESQLTDPPEWPKISVIIPAYNEEKVIRTTIESLLATDYANKEIILVDDGSKDQTLTIALQYKDRIKVIHKENGGKASALNQGLLYTTGDIVTIVDADTIIGNSALKYIARGMAQENVAAVAGNVKIRNKMNWLTWCQALEYLSGIQIMRRGLDYFGAITIVPGALGAFRKKKLEEAGTYHKETLVEDFDATMKVLRSGMVVSGSNKATAYTQAPQTLQDFWKQRKRWYRGNLQVLKRHSDILLNPRFGYLHRISYPLMAIHMLVIPIAGLMMWGFAAYQLIQGEFMFVVYTLGMYITLQYLMSAMAVRMDGDDKKMILYSVFLVIGYKQIIDFMQLKAVIEEVIGKKAIWTSAQRVKQ
ncbi:MAG: glycosyltransferase family 2 protein [Candidatus Nitrosotenuis sp.]